MPWDIDQESIVKLIVVLFFLGAGLVQMLFKTLGRARKVEEARRGEVKVPAKDIRDFLKEIREGSAPSGTPADRPAGADGGERERMPSPAETPRPVYFPTPARGRQSRPAKRREERAGTGSIIREPVQPASSKRSVHEYIEDLARQARAEEATAPESMTIDEVRELRPLEPSRELSSLGESVERKFGVTGAGPETAAAAAAAARLAVLPHELTLRQAMIAQVILGPPRARGLLRRPGRRVS